MKSSSVYSGDCFLSSIICNGVWVPEVAILCTGLGGVSLGDGEGLLSEGGGDLIGSGVLAVLTVWGGDLGGVGGLMTTSRKE